MFIGGVTVVLIGQVLLNDVTNTDYVKLIIAPHLLFSLIVNLSPSINLNLIRIPCQGPLQASNDFQL